MPCNFFFKPSNQQQITQDVFLCLKRFRFFFGNAEPSFVETTHAISQKENITFFIQLVTINLNLFQIKMGDLNQFI